MTEIKFDSAALKANRNPLRRTGSSLGGQFYRINKFAGNPDDVQKCLKVHQDGDKELYITRPIARVKVTPNDIFSVEFIRDAIGNNVVVLNKGANNEARITLEALSSNGDVFLKSTEENIAKAIASPDNKNLIFKDPDDIVNLANQFNRDEIARIDALVDKLKNEKNNLIQTINNNNDRARQYKDEMAKDPANDNVIIAGHIETEA